MMKSRTYVKSISGGKNQRCLFQLRLTAVYRSKPERTRQRTCDVLESIIWWSIFCFAAVCLRYRPAFTLNTEDNASVLISVRHVVSERVYLYISHVFRREDLVHPGTGAPGLQKN